MNACFRFAALTTLVLSCLSAEAVELRGFRGIPWGADADSLGDAVQVSSRDGVQCWRRERERKRAAGNPLLRSTGPSSYACRTASPQP